LPYVPQTLLLPHVGVEKDTVGVMKALGLKYWFTLRGYRFPLKFGFQLGRTGLRASP